MTLSLVVALGVLIALLHPLASVNSHVSGTKGKKNDISCSSLAVLQDKILLCQSVTSDLDHVKMICIKNTRNERQLSYLNHLLYLNIFTFLLHPLTLIETFSVKEILSCHVSCSQVIMFSLYSKWYIYFCKMKIKMIYHQLI